MKFEEENDITMSTDKLKQSIKSNIYSIKIKSRRELTQT